MIASPNTYWLQFFLIRNINVMCWNYRGYGYSTLNFYERLNPYLVKADAERVLDFTINKLRVRGKIGTHGRSLGGIASCHLAVTYPDIVQLLIVDRSFCELSEAGKFTILGRSTELIFNWMTMRWVTFN